MVTLARLGEFISQGHQVTVIQPSTHHYYSGMGPGMLGSTYNPGDIRFATRHVVEKAKALFIQDYAETIDPIKKTVLLRSGTTVDYDVLSCNAGSFVPRACIQTEADDVFTVKPIEALIKAQQRLIEICAKKKAVIALVGGGPSAAELAGNILQLAKSRNLNIPQLRIFSSTEFMGRFPAKIRQKVIKSLCKRGVEILENSRVSQAGKGQVVLESGSSYQADQIFMALGVKPSEIFTNSGLPVGPDGGLLVNKFLQSTGYPEIFGGGDCIYFQDQALDKVGVYAVRQNPVLCHNLLAALTGGELQSFDPGGAYLLIFNLGEGLGVLHKSWLTLDGRLAFVIKDYIDRKFMKKFQEIE